MNLLPQFQRLERRKTRSTPSARLRVGGVVLLIGALLIAEGAGAQSAEHPAVEISPGRARAFHVAVQRFADRSHNVNDRRADDLRAAIGRALEFNGVLLPLDPRAYLGPQDSKPLSNRGRSDCSDWTQSGADALLEGEIRRELDTIVVEFAVWDTARCLRMMRKTMRRARAEGPRLARAVADQVVKGFTGTEGSAATEITFVTERTGQREVFVMDADGTNARAATNSPTIKSFPGWLPGGEAIIYTSYTKSGHSGLFMTSRGRVRPGLLFPQVLPDSPKYRGVFSPTGSRLAIVASTPGSTDIYTIRRNGADLRKLTRPGSIEVGPSWSPDGRHIAFVSDRSGSPQVYTMDSDGNNTRRLTFESSYATSPAWSPDGRWIAYESRVEGQFDIWIIDPTGKINLPVIAHRRSDESPSWSPDGRKLAFCSNRRGRYDIYVVDVNGEQLQRLSENQGANLSPAWGPFPRE